MSKTKAHDLYDFLRQMSVEMSAEYDRIQMRATEDPGTAGDQGEENWAAIFRDWLPRSYEVVTRGRIISVDGSTSPQVDVLILKGSYPKKLLNKKLYLAAGVAAAFECKTTLKGSHVIQTMKRCAQIKALYPPRRGTPYKELHSPLIYGLLAHSHVWKSEGSTPEQNVEQKLSEADGRHVSHPQMQLDVLCVADLGAWVSAKVTFVGPPYWADWSKKAPIYGPTGSATSAYMGYSRKHEQVEQFTPIGVLISCLCQKLAWENSELRDLADYYRVAKIAGSGSGDMRLWPSSIYSDEVRRQVESGLALNPELWDEWQPFF
jgi:hypothetical protein